MHQLIYSVSPGLLALELYAFFRTLLKFLYFEMYTELLSVKKSLLMMPLRTWF
jgi:hypothetical protein